MSFCFGILFNLQGQFRGRTEIAPDQREKFLQRFQQVQQHGHSNLLGMPTLAGGNHKQFSAQQQNPLLQQVVFFFIIFIIESLTCPFDLVNFI